MRDNWTWDEVKPQVHRVFKSNDKNDYLILLSEGRLVNLGNATGHPSRIMDGLWLKWTIFWRVDVISLFVGKLGYHTTKTRYHITGNFFIKFFRQDFYKGLKLMKSRFLLIIHIYTKVSYGLR
jgi:hypothetical protein